MGKYPKEKVKKRPPMNIMSNWMVVSKMITELNCYILFCYILYVEYDKPIDISKAMKDRIP